MWRITPSNVNDSLTTQHSTLFTSKLPMEIGQGILARTLVGFALDVARSVGSTAATAMLIRQFVNATIQQWQTLRTQTMEQAPRRISALLTSNA